MPLVMPPFITTSHWFVGDANGDGVESGAAWA